MEEQSKLVLRAASFLTSYPGNDAFWDDLGAIETWASELSDSPETDYLHGAVRAFQQAGNEALQREYVATFDFSEGTALYLTAHEFGDSRNRGPALVELRKTIAMAGYEEPEDQLPDYLPLLFELLTVLPQDEAAEQLALRLAVVCQTISTNLAQDSPYAAVFRAVSGVLPHVDLAKIENPFPMREAADTDELPYPIHYD